MIVFNSRAKFNGPMILLILTRLSSVIVTTGGLLSNSNTASLAHLRLRNNQLSCRRLLPTIPFPSSNSRTTGCNAKRDISVDNDDVKKQETLGQIDENDETKLTENGSNDLRLQEKSNSPSPTPPQSLSTPAVLFAALLFVSFWPLLALLRTTSNPIDGFDIDMFMALKGIIDTSPMGDTDPTIMELPSLSPAEQLVGSIFGPPH